MAGRPGALSLFPALRRNALHKGLLGGSRGWMAVGVFVWGGWLMKKMLGRTEQVVATEVLKPGQILRVEAIAPPTRSERRAARGAR